MALNLLILRSSNQLGWLNHTFCARISTSSFLAKSENEYYKQRFANNWYKVRKHKFPRDLALEHMDNFYAKVFGLHWNSARLALLSPNKYAAVVNIFADPEKTEQLMEELDAIDLARYYRRHWKKYKRHKTRQEVLQAKRAARTEKLAAEQGIDPSSIDPDSVIVSDVSDSEIRARGAPSTASSEAEDFIEMFQTEIEANRPELEEDDEDEVNERFINPAGVNINLYDFVQPASMKFHEEIVTDLGYYNFYSGADDLNLPIIEEDEFEFPETLRTFTFSRRALQEFPTPKVLSNHKVFNYYCLDGASLLPVISLGLKPGDSVADFCASPGGKSLAMLMTLRPSALLCNELSLSRLSRLRRVISSHIPDIKSTQGIVTIQQGDATKISGMFDKILLDVPCTNDRNSVRSDENNLFKNGRINERIALPQTQMSILVNGLKCLKPGGALVYSTCTMSPIQNEGVVHMALKEIRNTSNMELAIVDQKEALRPLRGLFKFHRFPRYGQLIMPFFPSNFGPMYFCKIVRTD